MLDIQKIRKEFPFLQQKHNDCSIVYLDTAASAQKPLYVINDIKNNYINNYANVHRGIYNLSDKATEKYENTRYIVKKFINANTVKEIIFTKGTTESINLIAYSLLNKYFDKNDEIIITEMEHHSNIIPWQLISKYKSLKIKYTPILNDGNLDINFLLNNINKKTKLIAFTHCSNVLGIINPIKTIIKSIRNINPSIAILIDGAQSVVHQKIDVIDIDCDFFTFSSHKIYGPTGVGVLYVKNQWYSSMTAYQGGGEMIETVNMKNSTFSEPPYKFEAGTPNIVGVISLGKAIEYIENIGMNNIQSYENKLLIYAQESLERIPRLKMIGNKKNKAGIITFTIDQLNSNDLGILLNIFGICVRTGHHCAQLLSDRFKLSSSMRISLGIYNIDKDIDLLIKYLYKAINMLK